MKGKVFISCGQRPPHEKRIAEKVADILKQDFQLKPYLSIKAQSTEDIMSIIKELRTSDYYLFIDFLRKKDNPEDYTCSLFSHQELALAHHFGFTNIIALREKGASGEGFMKYVLSNPQDFSDEADLYSKLRRLVEERGWTSSYSRNLVLASLIIKGPVAYCDRPNEYNNEFVYQAKVENRRPDVAAVEAVCILDKIKYPDGTIVESPDRAHLKWARQAGYSRTILPSDYGIIDLFAIRENNPGIFLHSAMDWTPRPPIVFDNGQYQFYFKLS